jgi:hypothetical protein
MVAEGALWIATEVLKVSFLGAIVRFLVGCDSLGTFHAGHAPSLDLVKTEGLLDGYFLASHHANGAQGHVAIPFFAG